MPRKLNPFLRVIYSAMLAAAQLELAGLQAGPQTPATIAEIAGISAVVAFLELQLGAIPAPPGSGGDL